MIIDWDWQVRIWKNPVSDFLSVWLLRRHPDKISILGPDLKTVTEIDPWAILPEPTLQISPDTLRAFVDAASGFTSADDATRNHLKDAIMVRDRLLTIVERS